MPEEWLMIFSTSADSPTLLLCKVKPMAMQSVDQHWARENLDALLQIIALGEEDRLDERGHSPEEVSHLLAQDRIDQRQCPERSSEEGSQQPDKPVCVRRRAD
jgi:hypothetical protein